ncbi:MAG TPA: SUMF1/EgtB/PvdO family nonheme iron enzyme [Candidatus Baltobacteraceae bacterium]|jgi:formylglycine-generating enzyme required for sulfatase activity|nr:SUMF1/EgtB/PvdO family nonheme iron enzyme [Candidatus Baltobacteraceae bacterium]
MRVLRASCAAMGFVFAGTAVLAKPVDFATDVKPILEMNCVACHNAQHAEENGNYRLDTREEAFKPRKKTQRIVPGQPDDSQLYYSTVLPESDDSHMPPSNKMAPLSKEDSETLRQWILEGANWPDGITLTVVMKVKFVRDIEPILEHGGPLPDKSKDLLRLWLAQGGNWPAEVKFPSAKAAPAAAAVPAGGKIDFVGNVAPVLAQGGPLSDKARETLQMWVDQGASWPADYHLGRATGSAQIREMELVEQIHEKILDTSKEKTEADMKPYTNTIPGTRVAYAMVPIPSGQFIMGSPAAEPHRNADEGPQHPVAIDAFWMEQCEVTWNEYELFMYPDENAPAPPTDGTTNYTSAVADAVARPTKPYVEMSFGMGKDGYPAISMTQHGCNIYCQWLSAKTGHFYRLPTEAEWEYACRAGTQTAYFFGDDPSQLGQYAWDADNSDMKYQKVGRKKPNPWGLYDILGNVDEWTLDQYDTNYYKQFTSLVTEPWNKPTRQYPIVVRGGSWQDDADKLRCACRRGSSPDWKMQDPQLPKSIWYFTDAQFVGFRIIRPLKIPSTEEMFKYWHLGVERE